jgi:hypothetical protein
MDSIFTSAFQRQLYMANSAILGFLNHHFVDTLLYSVALLEFKASASVPTPY